MSFFKIAVFLSSKFMFVASICTILWLNAAKRKFAKLLKVTF